MNCRHCQSELSVPFLDLGFAPPSNAYLKRHQLQAAEIYLPLNIRACPKCWLVQTLDFTGKENLFNEDYAYFSSYSSTWLKHAENYVDDTINRFQLNSHSLVCEVAANDGYLLQYFQERQIPCFGVEPTKSTAKAAKQKGLEIIEDFFGVQLVQQLVGLNKQVDLALGNNVLAHVPDINDFVAGFAMLLKPNGVLSFEFPHLLNMVQHNQFDTAYHEHYSYLSLYTVKQILEKQGLNIFDVEQLETHGGSLRVWAQLANKGTQPITSQVNLILALEKSAGMLEAGFYQQAQTRALKAKLELLAFLVDAKQRHKKVAAYGAAAKGNTLLNFSGVHSDFIEFVVDLNPHKQNQFLPGSHIPILGETALKAYQPDYILILPWNLKTEIMQQLHYVRDWGAEFVIAIPSLVLVS